ncbi:hypothetical protein OS493_019038 [Desmophyllum pertusum]|uniref:N-acetyltransferase domain-containing protein n=1 Tax=Desmophyllum pertusum TaxID=174260 RepID=A0A9W9Z1C0_9CNID|nr:hypothetical protein OS493_019038 [Desmophyllum pertusum]
MEEFKIRLINTEEEYESVVLKAMAEEGWRPGLKDAECYRACDPTAAFVGELNGKPICCASMTKYGDRFAFGGCYIVSKEHRGKGYGVKIYNAAIASAESRSIGIFALLHMEETFQSCGFHSQFYGARFDFHLPTTMTCFAEISEKSPVEIKGIEQVNLEALFEYDTIVFGVERHAFLSKWLHVTGSHARVATNSEGSIVSYTVARPTFVKEEGYRIGPLFADCQSIAEKLLKAVFEELLQQEEPPSVVCIDTPTKRAIELAEKLQGKRSFDQVYMVMKDPPDACFDKWFYPLPFPTAPQSSARAVSTQLLNERMKEMSERIEAMDQITHNMDREFKSSRVLLSAIQSIDEVLNPSSRPSSAEVMSSRGSGGSRRGMPRRWGDTAPWRRGTKKSAERQPVRRLPQTEGTLLHSQCEE